MFQTSSTDMPNTHHAYHHYHQTLKPANYIQVLEDHKSFWIYGRSKYVYRAW